MKVTYKTKAWASEYNRDTLEEMATEEGADRLMYSNSDFSKSGCTLVGTATVNVEFVNRDEVVNNKIAALREVIASTRADAQAKVTRLEGEIQKLLCIENGTAETAKTADDDYPF